MVDRITIANMDTTMLISVVSLCSHRFQFAQVAATYHVHAFIAETTGFTMMGEVGGSVVSGIGSLSAAEAQRAQFQSCGWGL